MRKNLHFGGCGGLYPYFLGVAHYIQKNYNLDNVIFTGSSAGCFPALCMAMEKDIDLLYNEWNIPFLQDVNQTKLGPMWNWYDLLRKHTYKHLPDNIDNLKLNIWITKTPNLTTGWQTELVKKWSSKEDLIDCMVASGYVPIYGKSLTTTFRKSKCIDCCIHSNSHSNTNSNSYKKLEIDMWRPMKKLWYFCSSNIEWSNKLYLWGQNDAKDHKDELDEFFIPKFQ